MGIPFKLKSGGRFKATINKIKGTLPTVVGAKLTVPPELAWWYWMEYGTAPHVIKPNSSKYLVFPGPNGKTFAEEVNHPGTKPLRIVETVYPEIKSEASRILAESFAKGALTNPELFRQAFMDAVQRAKVLIVESMAKTLQPNGPRPVDSTYPKQSGKLQGKLASNVFEEQSTVVEIEE